MSKSIKKNIKKTANSAYEDGYHSKQKNRSNEERKHLKHFENALRSRDLEKIIAFGDQL